MVYIIHIYDLCKHAEIWPWSSSMKVIHRPPKYLTDFWRYFHSADCIAWKLLKMGLRHLVHDEVPTSSLLTLAIVFKVTLGLLKWLKMVPFSAYICLYKTGRPYTSTSFIIGCITYWLMLIIVSTGSIRWIPWFSVCYAAVMHFSTGCFS